jgi:thiamine kinase-like enzyme
LIDLELAGPNYRGFDLMKLFRAKPELFSEESFKYFMSCYAENEPRTTVDELILECKTCEALTWLEAAIFFALMLSAQIGKPISSTFQSKSTVSTSGDYAHNAELLENRWSLYLSAKHFE